MEEEEAEKKKKQRRRRGGGEAQEDGWKVEEEIPREKKRQKDGQTSAENAESEKAPPGRRELTFILEERSGRFLLLFIIFSPHQRRN